MQRIYERNVRRWKNNSITSNLSRTEIRISWNLPICICTCIYISYFLRVKISLLPLWSNIILSSFSQRCLLLPLPEYYSLLASLDFFSLSWDFFFLAILMLLLFFITATRFSFFFDSFSNTSSTLSPLSSKLLFFLFFLKHPLVVSRTLLIL